MVVYISFKRKKRDAIASLVGILNTCMKRLCINNHCHPNLANSYDTWQQMADQTAKVTFADHNDSQAYR